MPDAREYQSDFEAAEAAATEGDFARAETLLRDGLARQEAALGSPHPDVASTLNNLAVVCETVGKLDDAERFYRRAHAVALATRHDGDPLVTTSLANLQDFCRAHGRRFDETAPPTAAFEPSPPATPPAAAPVARPAPRASRAPAATATATAAATRPTPPAASVPRGFVVALFLVAALATGAVSWLWLRPTVPDTPASRAEVADDDPRPGPASNAAGREARPTAAAPTAAPSAPPPSAPPAAPRATAPPPPPTPAAAAATRDATPAPAAPSTRDAVGATDARVMSSELCESLTTGGRAWRCAPIDSPAAPGRVSFVTRIASPRPLRLQHRWSQDGRVRQIVALSVAASPTSGYRTFSRQSVSRGAWTVAVIDADGAVLREVSFEVR